METATTAADQPEMEGVQADAPVEAVEAEATEPEPAPRMTLREGQYNAVGRRKTATARVFLRSGKGTWRVNGRSFEEYFPRAVLRQAAARPLALTQTDDQFDVLVNVRGGGPRGQAEAVRLAVARALVKVDESMRKSLRSESLLTRDAREVERKKPGRPGARKRFQFSKR